MSASSPAPGAAGPVSPAGPIALSAQQLHEVAVQAFRVGNRGRLSLCDSLRIFAETRLYFDLGFPDIAAYADAFFQLSRAEAFEHVRVAKALLELALLREAFAAGKVGWTVLKAVTRVASVESQADWIDFAARNGGEHTLAEARDARRRGRDRPRESSFGLPNLDQRLVLRFSRSDMAKVREWIDATCATVAEKTGTEGVSVEQALLFLCEQSAGGEGEGEGGGKVSGGKRGPSRARLVYQRCPDCRRGRMGTREGFVEVEPEEIERHEGCAEAVVIDGPTPPKLRRRILAREAERCSNPRCGNRADHCHHIRFRSAGGKSCLSNVVAVCSTCHSLVHAGLLRVTGSAAEELCWTPAFAPDALVPRGRQSSNEDSALDSESRVASRPSVDLEALAQGLVRLGVSITRSRRLIGAAFEKVPIGERTDESVLRTALAAC